MSSVLPLIAVIVTVIAGWALIKRVQTHRVLLFAGLAILICVALAGTGFLPKGVKPSGFWLFDIFATLKSIATKKLLSTEFAVSIVVPGVITCVTARLTIPTAFFGSSICSQMATLYPWRIKRDR